MAQGFRREGAFLLNAVAALPRKSAPGGAAARFVNLGGSSSRMTHFSAAKQRVRRVVRTILSRKVSERDSPPSMIEIWAMPEDGPPNGSGLPVGRGGAVFSEEVSLGEGE